MKKPSLGQAFVWILLALVIVGLGGFGVTNFGGSITSIGKVGGQDIGANDYARAIDREMRAFQAQTGQPIGFAQAQVLGLDARARQQLVTGAALDDLAHTMGLSVGDARLAQEIRGLGAFQGLDGRFDRDAYGAALRQSGYTEREFENQVREDVARNLIRQAVAGGLGAPEGAAAAVWSYLGERRSFTLVRLTEDDLAEPVPEPTPDDLRAWYEAHPDSYTRPAGRRIAYAVLLPEDVVDEVPVDEAALQRLYQTRIDEFVQPERRLVERLVFPDEAAAAAARERLDAGTASFDDLVAERGLTLADIDMGDMAQADLGTAGAEVFAVEAPGVAGPLPSALGPALYRVNGVLASQEITFEAAREALRAEYAMDGARRLIGERVDEIDDLLAGGATIEDLAAEGGMTAGTVDLFPDTAEGIAAYPAFRTRAAQARADSYPEVFELDDGGIAALRLEAELPAELRPYDAVAEQVADDWRTAERAARLAARLAEAEAAVTASGSLADAGGTAETFTGLGRDGFVENAPASLIGTVFGMAPGDLRAITEGDFVALLRLDSVIPADQQSPDALIIKAAVAGQMGQDMAQDAFLMFSAAAERRAGLRLDQIAIDAVHAQMR
ncbi:peptidylprolyl isomerase [Ruixingdingia sedimenti]|uniref:Peptidylprolyl isomerase n=1 Tax=Ruixingdingia sedimenti TaxID=3073604 RepID=A0ABU1F628_9RHOB|nr:peptidylprolyl isomerase [Xinfangfangia sp. LG-4]MDR5651887.1 peptidylprolyl isomerase [Xinfangfangia sp. LG-4]